MRYYWPHIGLVCCLFKLAATAVAVGLEKSSDGVSLLGGDVNMCVEGQRFVLQHSWQSELHQGSIHGWSKLKKSLPKTQAYLACFEPASGLHS